MTQGTGRKRRARVTRSQTAVAHAKQEAGQRRTTIVFVVVMALTAVMIFRLFQIQILSFSTYNALATGQHQIYEDLSPVRGEILVEDTFSNTVVPVATNKEFSHIFASPRDINDREKAATITAEVLDVERADLMERFAKERDLYEPVKHRVDEETTERLFKKLEEEGVEGIFKQPETFRHYPDGSFAAHLLGFVRFDGKEHIGQYGIEGKFNELLAGTQGYIQAERDAFGRFVTLGDSAHQIAEDGSDIVLTIDRTIQFHAERALQKGVERFGAEEGSAIVIDPSTGEILAMANVPTFDPNNYAAVEKVEDYNNSAVHDLYEPGSIAKPLVVGAALNEGLISPYSVHNDASGEVTIGRYTIRNFDQKANGNQTVTNILERSSNTGMVWIGQMLGAERLYHYYDLFGLTGETGVDISESYGTMLSGDQWREIDLATRSFGQSYAVTPLQMAVAETAIANEGVIMKPHVIKRIIHPSGNEEMTQPQELRRVLEPASANTLAAMMVSTVENGFGDTAKIPGYRIAGKTGTAQVPRDDGPGYAEGRKITSFVGFGPVEDPQFLVLVKLNDPGGDVWGSTTAGPIAKEIMEEVIRVKRIPPSE